jgi:hypothetical protein
MSNAGTVTKQHSREQLKKVKGVSGGKGASVLVVVNFIG